MRNLFLALLLLIFVGLIFGCERVEREARPRIAPEKPSPAEKLAPKTKPLAPEAAKAPEERQLPKISKEEILLDLQVCDSNIASATKNLTSGQAMETVRANVQNAIKSLAFVETSLPSSLARELTQRSLLLIKQARIEEAVQTTGQIALLAPQIEKGVEGEELKNLAGQVINKLHQGDLGSARESLTSLQEKFQDSQEQALARAQDHLRGALSSTYRDTREITLAELNEASKYLEQLHSQIEQAW